MSIGDFLKGVVQAGASKPSTKPEAEVEAAAAKVDAACGPTDEDDEDDDMVRVLDPTTGEWGGPTKGGSMPEPTRFGDWERKGRCTDFN